MNPYLHLLLERDFLVVACSSIAAFATIITLGLPYMSSDRLAARMKSVSTRREELRQRHFDSLQQVGRKTDLRSHPVGFMHRFVEGFDLRKMLESPGMRMKLARAGYRGEGPFVAFMFFRCAMPPLTFLIASAYLFALNPFDWSVNTRLIASVAAALAGYYLPDMFLNNRIQKRREFDHARLSRRAGPAADLRRIRECPLRRHSTACRKKSGGSRPNWRRNWH